MTWTPASERPPVAGWYAVLQSHSERPIVLWWSLLSTQWRSGAMVVNATHWFGPFDVPARPDA